MGDMAEDFKLMEEDRKERHLDMKKRNIKTLVSSGFELTFANEFEACLFRYQNYPKVDFFPSTGRWRIVDKGKQQTMKGGAANFLEWFKNQKIT